MMQASLAAVGGNSWERNSYTTSLAHPQQPSHFQQQEVNWPVFSPTPPAAYVPVPAAEKTVKAAMVHQYRELLALNRQLYHDHLERDQFHYVRPDIQQFSSKHHAQQETIPPISAPDAIANLSTPLSININSSELEREVDAAVAANVRPRSLALDSDPIGRRGGAGASISDGGGMSGVGELGEGGASKMLWPTGGATEIIQSQQIASSDALSAAATARSALGTPPNIGTSSNKQVYFEPSALRRTFSTSDLCSIPEDATLPDITSLKLSTAAAASSAASFYPTPPLHSASSDEGLCYSSTDRDVDMQGLLHNQKGRFQNQVQQEILHLPSDATPVGSSIFLPHRHQSFYDRGIFSSHPTVARASTAHDGLTLSPLTPITPGGQQFRYPPDTPHLPPSTLGAAASSSKEATSSFQNFPPSAPPATNAAATTSVPGGGTVGDAASSAAAAAAAVANWNMPQLILDCIQHIKDRQGRDLSASVLPPSISGRPLLSRNSPIFINDSASNGGSYSPRLGDSPTRRGYVTGTTSSTPGSLAGNGVGRSSGRACDLSDSPICAANVSRVKCNTKLIRPKVQNPSFASKFFVGGLPSNITDSDTGMRQLKEQFAQFAPENNLDNIEVKFLSKGRSGKRNPGFAYITFIGQQNMSNCAVKRLLQRCKTFQGGSYVEYNYYWPSHDKVEIIPWVCAYSHYARLPHKENKDCGMTVFVGGLHGLMTAETLVNAFQETFGDVVSAQIDVDADTRYPIGSGRVQFCRLEAYQHALISHIIEIKTDKFTKLMQIEPFVEQGRSCQDCESEATCLCRKCIAYLCDVCYNQRYPTAAQQEVHSKVLRNGTLKRC